jgi:hypothetical protein
MSASKGRIFCAVLSLLVAAGLGAQGLFNSKMSDSEKSTIERGEVLIRNIGKSANISINPDIHPAVRQAVGIITKLKPSYLAEVIQMRPYDPELIPRIEEILLDVPGYKGIPYYSERGGRFYDLYSSAKVKTRQEREGITTIDAALVMPPFSPYDVRITVVKETTTEETAAGRASLFYQMENISKITAEDMPAITVAKDRGMQSLIVVFPYGDQFVFYGIGGVNAPVIFFLKERIQISFINRIKTFCMYVYEKL